MGRLKNTSWLPGLIMPVFLAVGIFFTIRPVLAQLGQPLEPLPPAQQLDWGVETVNGYRQIFYVYKNSKTFVTTGHLNHYSPIANGDYAAWTVVDQFGASQIELRHLPTGVISKVASSGTNQNPRLNSSGHLVWERWVEDRWQVFYFDGSISQLTQGDVSVRPDIHGSQIIYARQGQDGNWAAYEYDVNLRVERQIKSGDEAAWPRFEKGEVKYGFLN